MTSLFSPLQHLFHRRPHRGNAALPSADERTCTLIKQLPRRTQQVFLLSRANDLSYATISQRLSITLDELESDMVKALEHTRESAAHSAQQRQAVEWYVKLQSPHTTASERIDFRRWLDAAPAHLTAFHDTELHWRGLLAPARHMATHDHHQRRYHPRQLGAWLTGLLSMILLMVLAF